MSEDGKPGYKQTEVGVIPEDWEMKPLSKFLALQRGHDLTERDRRQGDIPVMGSAGPNGFHDTALVKGPGVVLGRSGASFGQAHYCAKDFWPHNTALYVTDFLGNNRLFAFYLLKSLDFSRHNSGGAQQSLNRNFIAPIPIRVPPAHEQEAIAEALSDTDALIESLTQLITKKRQIKQGAMQELLTGKRRLHGFSGEWQVKALGEIGESLIGLTYKPSDVRDRGLLVLRSSNVFEGTLRFDDNVFVEMDVSERIIVRRGDILICVRNGSRDLIGKCARIDERAEGLTFGAFMAVFRTPFHNFVHHQFQSDVIKRQIHEHLGATINQITNKSLNSFQIPFPTDEEEQTAIATILSDMDAEIAALETKLAKARQLKQGMMHNLLTGRIRLV